MSAQRKRQNSWYKMSVDNVLKFFDVNQGYGLSNEQVSIRRKKFGFNRPLNIFKTRSNLFKVKVLRENKIKEISPTEIVLGDIVNVSEGDIVCADIRLIKVFKVKVNQSILSGSDVLGFKNTYPLSEETKIENRLNMIYAGSTIIEGSAQGVVVDIDSDINQQIKKAPRRNLIQRRQVSKLYKQGVYLRNDFNLKLIKGIESMIVNISLQEDLIKDLVRKSVTEKNLNLAIVMDQATYLSLRNKIPGMSYISSKEFNVLTNKALMQLDGPIVALVDVGYDEINRYLRIKSLKEEKVMWLDNGSAKWPVKGSAISATLAKTASNIAINEADIVLRPTSNHDLLKKINQLF